MMSATAIVAFFSLLSAASEGAHHSASGTLAMLSACRWADSQHTTPSLSYFVILGSCSVLVSVRSILVDLYLLQSRLNRNRSVRMLSTDGLLLQPVRFILWT